MPGQSSEILSECLKTLNTTSTLEPVLPN